MMNKFNPYGELGKELLRQFNEKTIIDAMIRKNIVKRTLRERFFTLPWRPWKKIKFTDSIVEQITEKLKIGIMPDVKVREWL